MSLPAKSSPRRRCSKRRSLPVLMVPLLLATMASGCDPGPELPEIHRVRVRRYSHGLSARAWPVRLEGRRIATSRANPLRFELLRVDPFWPRVRATLAKMRITGPGRVSAEVPAGLAPGEYRLVVFRGRRWHLAHQRFKIRKPEANLGPVIIDRTHALRPDARGGGRLVIDGANLQDPVLVTLHGPHQRRPGLLPLQSLDRPRPRPRPRPRASAKTMGPPKVTVPGVTDRKPAFLRHRHGHGHGKSPKRKLKLPFKPTFRRMAVHELSQLISATPTRLVARLPETLPAGRYYIQVYTQTNRGEAPDQVFVLRPARAGAGRLWGGLFLALILLGAAGTTWRFARPSRGHRRAVVGLLSFLLVVLALLASTL